MYKKRKKIARIMAFILAIAMLAGSLSYLFLYIGSELLGYAGPGVVYAATLDDENDLRIDLLKDVIKYIQDNFDDKVSTEDLVRGAYDGVINALGDPWSEYYMAGDAAASELSQSLDNNYCGIGVTMQQDGSKCRITGVNKKGPAYAAGIKVDSFIVAVDGKSVIGVSTTDIAIMIRGEEGSTVSVTIETDGVRKTYNLKRTKLVAASVQGEILEGKIGYIDITSFSVNTAEEFAEVRADLLAQGIKALIIDLRDNGGGYLTQAVKIADQLMDEGLITQYYQQGNLYGTETSTKNNTKKVPTVVLVNENTASASECLAGALQDSGTAKIVGEVTYGKGEAQSMVNIINGDSIKLSIFYFKTPKGNDINEVGIIPDEIVYSSGQVTQSKANEILATLVPMDTNRYYEGEYGLNVLAAQQRMQVMGYDVDINGYMDDKTMAALRRVQRAAGSYSYGNLDKFTINAISSQFDAYLGINSGDVQLKKALEMLK